LKTEEKKVTGFHWIPRLSEGTKTFTRYAISAGLLIYLLTALDFKQIENVLLESNFLLLAAVVLIIGLERTIGAYRWHLLLTVIHIAIPWRVVFKATFISGFFGNFLPGIVGTEVLRVATITQSTRDLSSALSTVVFDRALGALALVGIGLAAAAVAPGNVPPFVSLAAGAMLLALGLGFLAITSAAVRPLLLNAGRQVCPAMFRQKLEAFFLAVELIAVQKKMLLLSLLLAVAYQMARVVGVIVGAFALGYFAIPLVYFLLYVPIILLLMQLPISLGGLGVREAAFVSFFGAGLMAPEAAFTLALIIYAGSVVSQLPGLAFWLQGIEDCTSMAQAVEEQQ